jgi:hypothetical protein
MLKIIRFNPVEISDVLFHVLDYLDLLRMEVEPPISAGASNVSHSADGRNTYSRRKHHNTI